MQALRQQACILMRQVELGGLKTTVAADESEAKPDIDNPGSIFGIKHALWGWAVNHSAWLHNGFHVEHGETPFERACKMSLHRQGLYVRGAHHGVHPYRFDGQGSPSLDRGDSPTSQQYSPSEPGSMSLPGESGGSSDMSATSVHAEPGQISPGLTCAFR